MGIFKKIWQKIYDYFNPSEEECLRYLGILNHREMTQEEWEEEGRKLEELYALIDSAFPSDDKKSVGEEDTAEK